jgi:ribosome-binding protein aMBF1 (putative translation factor)
MNGFWRNKMEEITFGKCGICRQGELIAMKVDGSDRLLLMCDDCESQWNTPQDSTAYDKALTEEVSGLVLASSQDVLGAGWNKQA